MRAVGAIWAKKRRGRQDCSSSCCIGLIEVGGAEQQSTGDGVVVLSPIERLSCCM